MPTFGSSVITKSHKKFGPKRAPARRSAVTDALASSGRASTDAHSTRAATQISEGPSVPTTRSHAASDLRTSVTSKPSTQDQSKAQQSQGVRSTSRPGQAASVVDLTIVERATHRNRPDHAKEPSQKRRRLSSHQRGPDVPLPSIEGATGLETVAPKPRRRKSGGATTLVSAQTNLGPYFVSRPDAQQNQTQPSAQEIAIDALNDATNKLANKRGRKTKRPTTPEDGESAIIIPSEARMLDLCIDNGMGRKSQREQELRDLERAAQLRKAAARARARSESTALAQNAPAQNLVISASRGQGRLVQNDATVPLNVPRTIIVNGQIQIDEASLQIDRHAAAAVNRGDDELEPIDENDLSRKITSGTWLKRDKSGGWTSEMQDLFYQGLRMFGTDFELISKMFPGKTRHTIKLKFVREEKENYAKIKAALMGERIECVLHEYERLTGREYEDPIEVERLLEEDRRQLEEEQAAERQAMEEAAQEREAQANAEREAAIKALEAERAASPQRETSTKARSNGKPPQRAKKQETVADRSSERVPSTRRVTRSAGAA